MRRGRYDDYYDEVYGRTPPRRRRKKRGRGFLLLLVLLLALGALYMVRSGGLRVLSVPEENIQTDFEVDLEALAARITPDMAGADGLGAAEAQELLAAAEEAHGERADMLAFMAENIGIYSEEAYKTALVTPEKTAFALLTPFMSEQSEASASSRDVSSGYKRQIASSSIASIAISRIFRGVSLNPSDSAKRQNRSE